jgi:hypothetical protein
MYRNFSAFSWPIRYWIFFYSAPNLDAFLAVNGRFTPEAAIPHQETLRLRLG